ncbi:MAG: outer membrane protein assembly factor BamD [Bacteroidales bacterium]|nr:outer membrane protein assembly factor BamD [Bacteroidales bacterium]
MIKKTFKGRLFFIVILLTTSIITTSCNEYQKILKSSDYELKYQKANEYYDQKDYTRALTLFDELITIYRGTNKAEELYIRYSYCYFYNKDYMMAGHYFSSFASTFKNSKYTEEAEYMTAYCYYKDSPPSSLDQSNTMKAIEQMQSFINRYSQSERVGEANKIIELLREKLEEKSYLSARLYYDLENYKAAIQALKTSSKEYPDSKYREEILFLILKSSFLLAENSIEAKKTERFQNTEKEYYNFVAAFPQSENRKEADKLKEKASDYLASVKK